MGALTSLTGGGGLSASSSASTGPQKSGDIGGSKFDFGGINTGKQSQNSALMIGVVVVAIAAIAFLMFRKR